MQRKFFNFDKVLLCWCLLTWQTLFLPALLWTIFFNPLDTSNIRSTLKKKEEKKKKNLSFVRFKTAKNLLPPFSTFEVAPPLIGEEKQTTSSACSSTAIVRQPFPLSIISLIPPDRGEKKDQTTGRIFDRDIRCEIITPR